MHYTQSMVVTGMLNLHKCSQYSLLEATVIKEMRMVLTHFEKVLTCVVILKQSVDQLQKKPYFLI